MSTSPHSAAYRVWPVLIAMLLACVLTVRADGPRPAVTGPPKEEKTGAAKADDPKDRVKELEAALEQLRKKNEALQKKLDERQPAPVGGWKITGKVKGNVAELKIVFSFATDQENTPINLGCRQGFPTSVKLDGKVPAMRLGADGLVVEAPDARDHEAIVDLQVPLRNLSLAPSGLLGQAVQGFELSLPAAAVTMVEVDLPEGVKALEVNDKPLAPPLTLTGNRLAGLMGRAEQLKLAWPAPLPGAVGPVSVLTARARIVVRFIQNAATTEAELTLQDLGASLRDWQLQVPDKASVRLANDADSGRLRGEIQGSGVPGGRVTIPLQAPSSAPLKVIVTVRQPRSTPLSVGPFNVAGAASHGGIIWVDADAGQEVRCQSFHVGRAQAPPFELARVSDRRLLPENDRPPAAVDVDAGFRFWNVPGADKVDPRDPWFTVDLLAVPGTLDTRLQHTVKVKGKPTAPSWRLLTTFDVVPLRSGVDHLDVEWPSPWQFDRARGPRAEGLSLGEFQDDPQRRTTRFEFRARTSDSLKPFQLFLEAEPRAPDEPFAAVGDQAYASAVLPLPRPWDGRQPREIQDRGGQAAHTVTIVDEEQKFDFRVPQPPNSSLKLVTQEAHRLVWQAEKFPSQVAVAWQGFQPDLRADSVIGIVFDGKTPRVRHHFQFTFPEADKQREREVELRIPVGLEQAPQVIAPASSPGFPVELRWLDRSRTAAVCKLPVVDGVLTLDLEYRFAANTDLLPEAPKPFPVPLVVPAHATHGEMRVQIWEQPGVSMRPVEAAWSRATLEQVLYMPTAPNSAFRAGRPAVPLHLQREANPSESPAGKLPAVLVERALVYVRVNEAGFQEYDVRFLLGRVTEPYLDLRFPVAAATLESRVTLNGRRLDLKSVSGDSDGQLARIQLTDDLTKQQGVLEVRYQLSPGQLAGSGALRTVMQPVSIVGVTGGMQTRWRVDLPSGWVPLSLESGPAGGWQWGWRGWLLAAHPSTTVSDLAEWFSGGNDAILEKLPADEGEPTPSFVCWRGDLAPLTIYHAPQQAWLLTCSLGVLVLGLSLSFSALKPRINAPASRLLWPVLALLGLGAAALGLIWPGLLAALFYGCQPGLAVLFVVLIVQLLLNERYRRRVVFLPGFRRVLTGSSLARAGRAEAAQAGIPAKDGSGRSGSSSRGPSTGPVRVRAEPSTVDAPPEAAEG